MSVNAWADVAAGVRAFKEGDVEAAVREWKDASLQGDAKAAWMLGFAYENGMRVPKDPREAVKWLRMASEKDYPEAEAELGQLYMERQWRRAGFQRGTEVASRSSGP